MKQKVEFRIVNYHFYYKLKYPVLEFDISANCGLGLCSCSFIPKKCTAQSSRQIYTVPLDTRFSFACSVINLSVSTSVAPANMATKINI